MRMYYAINVFYVLFSTPIKQYFRKIWISYIRSFPLEIIVALVVVMVLLLLLSLSFFFKDTLCSRKLYVNETIFLTEGTNQTVVKNKNYPASFFETNRSKVRTYSKSYSKLCESILVQSTFFANSVSHLHPSHNSFFPINKTSKWSLLPAPSLSLPPPPRLLPLSITVLWVTNLPYFLQPSSVRIDVSAKYQVRVKGVYGSSVCGQ